MAITSLTFLTSSDRLALIRAQGEHAGPTFLDMTNSLGSDTRRYFKRGDRL
jgi:hypothetical protein